MLSYNIKLKACHYLHLPPFCKGPTPSPLFLKHPHPPPFCKGGKGDYFCGIDKSVERGIMLFYNIKLKACHYLHLPPFCKGGKGDYFCGTDRPVERRGQASELVDKWLFAVYNLQSRICLR